MELVNWPIDGTDGISNIKTPVLKILWGSKQLTKLTTLPVMAM